MIWAPLLSLRSGLESDRQNLKQVWPCSPCVHPYLPFSTRIWFLTCWPSQHWCPHYSHTAVAITALSRYGRCWHPRMQCVDDKHGLAWTRYDHPIRPVLGWSLGTQSWNGFWALCSPWTRSWDCSCGPSRRLRTCQCQMLLLGSHAKEGEARPELMGLGETEAAVAEQASRRPSHRSSDHCRNALPRSRGTMAESCGEDMAPCGSGVQSQESQWQCNSSGGK